MITHKKILYFSTTKATTEAFANFCVKHDLPSKLEFKLLDQQIFSSVFDLKLFLEENSDQLTSLYIIVDYMSLCGKEVLSNRGMMSNLILSYPEVHFFFDDSYSKSKQLSGDYCSFLFNDKHEGFLPSFHSFDINENPEVGISNYEYPFEKILNQRNNFFDASNLRAYLKDEKYTDLRVQPNFSKLQDSRRNNISVVVEEEVSQCLFNSYILYANGFRVIPVSTVSELKWVNTLPCVKDNKILVLRDSDLQFRDENQISNKVYTSSSVESINKVDWIRGFKHEATNGCTILNDPDNEFWNGLDKASLYFVSKGYKDGRLILNDPAIRKEGAPNMEMVEKSISVWGLNKPINGIYSTPHKINEVANRYQECRYLASDDTPKHRYHITTDRIDHDHSTPLDIYEMVRSMVKRAEHYYTSGNYLYAAIVSSEAIEVMNGFHLTLMLKAYYVNAVAENALSVRLLGADEDKLRDDTWFRLGVKAPEDLNRMCLNFPEFKKNILTSIYNETRRFCMEKMQLESAEVALSLLVHLNHKLIDYDSVVTDPAYPQKNKTKLGRGFSKYKTLISTYLVKKRNGIKMRARDLGRFIRGFPVSFVVLLAMVSLSLSVPAESDYFFWILAAVFGIAVLVLLKNPMQIVYGLVGTKGDIRKFIFMFAFVIMSFAVTYHSAFFKEAGVTYDIDVPQVEYHIFADDASYKESPQVAELNKTIDLTKGRYFDCCYESFRHSPEEEKFCRYYKRITFPFILRQTFITSLTTSPTDFYNSVSADYKNNDRNPKYTRLFNLIILYQILVSWIFLGVFISLIYQKFRNE